MKRVVVFMLTLAGLCSCVDDFTLDGNRKTTKEGEIAFSSASKAYTRASTGAEAAKNLGENFVVEAVKTIKDASGNDVLTDVMDNYNVNWAANTAGTTTSNTSDWEYVGLKSTKDRLQYIKYWDYSATSYNYAAYSLAGMTAVSSSSIGDESDKKIYPTDIVLTGTDWQATASNSKNAYQLFGYMRNLAKCYISDMYTAYASATATTTAGYSGKYNEEVTLRFRSLGVKVRIGFYETIPGYSVKDVKFWTAQDADSNTTPKVTEGSTVQATLFSKGVKIFQPDGKWYAWVSFPKGGSQYEGKQGFNQAEANFYPANQTLNEFDFKIQGKGTAASDGALDYKAPALDGEDIKTVQSPFMGRSSNEATFAGDPDADYYDLLLPPQKMYDLRLKVDYTLVSMDGSGEIIRVTGAEAMVPAQYLDWKPGYAYTYLFKISDNTNGSTGTDTDPAGLYPVTFDALEIDAEDGAQETVTLVNKKSISTYQNGKVVTENDEYVAGDSIWVMVQDVFDIELSGGSSTLWTIDNAAEMAAAGRTVTEADVRDELNVDYNVDDYGCYDRIDSLNRVKMTLQSLKFYEYKTRRPEFDQTGESAPCPDAAMFVPSANTTYAFAFRTQDDGTDTYLYSARKFKNGDTAPQGWDKAGVWYLDPDGKHPSKGDKYHFPYSNTETPPADWLTNWFTDEDCTDHATYYAVDFTEMSHFPTDLTGWYSDPECTKPATDADKVVGCYWYQKRFPIGGLEDYYRKHPFPTIAQGDSVYFYRRYLNRNIRFEIKLIKVK